MEPPTESGASEALAWPPGHFYSPVPSLAEVAARDATIFAITDRLAGVDLNVAGQLALFERLAVHYRTQPFSDQPGPGWTFGFDNPNFGHGEAVILHCLLQELRPKRVFEIGSGYSSCALVDLNRHLFDGAMQLRFFEPYPQLLHSLLGDDIADAVVTATAIQDVEPSVFAQLEAGDLLLIDSTHVTKTGSDVNHLLFHALPAVRPGVMIHFHDIYFPFEYPRDWVYAGRAWNEAYILRAFLQYNTDFEISFYNQYFAHYHHDRLVEDMPLCAAHAGSSLWLKRR